MTDDRIRTVSGIVVDTNGRGVAGGRLFFTSAPQAVPDVAAVTSSDGSFTLTAPRKGAYTIECVADGFRRTTVNVNIAQGDVTNVEIRLAPVDER